MNTAVNELVRSVIDKSSLDECSVDELQQLTQQYPYFGPAQFLLARKLKEETSPLYDQQCQRAILYFQDNLWFDYLSGEGIFTGTITVAQPAEVITPAQSPAVTETNTQQEIITGTIVTEEPVFEPAPVEQTEETPIVIELTGVSPANSETTIHVHEETIAATIVTEEPAPVLQEEEQPAVTEMNETLRIDTETNHVPEEIIAPLAPVELIPAVQEQPVVETNGETVTDLPAFKIEAFDKTASPLTFEPYHTVDYFASQGIRFREEEKPKDRFGQQLKSFTDWLKSMKRLPETEAAPAPPDDKKVTQLAEHSIVNRDVYTEAMAEVWEKQGNADKAIEIYGKLSLLNPAKSSYFAAKIEHLKNL